MSTDSARLKIENSDRQHVVETSGLRLCFRYETDRWMHTVLLPCGDGWLPVLESIEGAPHDAVPRSPAFQDLRFERIGPDAAEFQLLGQAGRGTYSAAIRFEAADTSISFDVFARSSRDGAALCSLSEYFVSPEIATADEQRDSGFLLRLKGGRPSGLLVAGSGVGFVGALAGGSAGDRESGIRFVGHSVAALSSETPPRSVRWQYQMRVRGGP